MDHVSVFFFMKNLKTHRSLHGKPQKLAVQGLRVEGEDY